MADTRATEFGWNDEDGGVSQVPEIPGDVDADKSHVISSHGNLSHEHIKDHEDSCIKDEDHRAQDAAMSCCCLVKSLTKEACNRIVLHKKDFARKVD